MPKCRKVDDGDLLPDGDGSLVTSGSEALMQPSDMTDAELDAALSRLALLHRDAPAPRRQVVGRVCDRVLDELLTRRENDPIISRASID